MIVGVVEEVHGPRLRRGLVPLGGRILIELKIIFKGWLLGHLELEEVLVATDQLLQKAEGEDDVEPEDACEELLVLVEVLNVGGERVHEEVVVGVIIPLGNPRVPVGHDEDEEVEGIGPHHEELREQPDQLVRLVPETERVHLEDDHSRKHRNQPQKGRILGNNEEDHSEQAHRQDSIQGENHVNFAVSPHGMLLLPVLRNDIHFGDYVHQDLVLDHHELHV